ncbi:type I restriction/modification system, specificity subunit [Campylobacter lari]|uniref:restriction endonuclease subunit S n=1 Tax=Campylobacter lari TaxID=201 RepID=UPI00215326E1|nr:restriction endonuclease subunit S [Campylobacter lari]MCR6559202.1 restriction endonuclease subunit S [Campylobacter lari]
MKNFKDSGIEWLGEIPEHWEVVKINKIVTFVNGYAFENFDFNPTFEIPVIRIGDIQKEKILYDNCLKTKEKEKLKQFLISNNDILIALSGATTGKIAFCDTDNKAYINQRVAIVRSKLKLVKYYFLTRGFSLLIELACNGSAQPNISTKEIGEFKIPLPPLKEQEQIANFLDEKCEQIKNFIEKKEKLINLLKEQKQALINETITKGLDKNVNFKDSGIKYLGEIPQHWKVKRLANFGAFLKGNGISRQDLAEDGESAILYGDIYTKYQIKTHFLHSKISKKTSLSATPIYNGDILFSGSGETKEDIGKSVVYLGDDNAFAGGDVIIFRQKENNALFLSYVLNTKYANFCKSIDSKGEIIVHIYASNLKDIKIPLPPLKEQEQIANFLDEKCEKIDLLIEKTEKQIKLIKEYKTTLINQAVCGRINL